MVRENFSADAQALGVALNDAQRTAFRRYEDMLLAENRRLNLTSITTPDEVQIKHFLDSLTGLALLPASAGLRVIDVGTGAGFPGIPLKIARLNLRLTLLEATRKKAGFVERLTDRLGLSHVHVIWERAETLSHDPAHREQYDVALARAVAALPTLLELLLPFCRVGGACIAWKGPRAEEEVIAAEEALALMGGRLREVRKLRLPGTDEPARSLIVVDKVAPTPKRYPRRPGIPAKRPLTP